jgi:hypothetical protein
VNLAADVRRAYPELFERIRAQCQWASDEVDLDEHAAGIVLVVVKARRAAA